MGSGASREILSRSGASETVQTVDFLDTLLNLFTFAFVVTGMVSELKPNSIYRYVDLLAAMRNRKNVDAFEFKVLLNEDGAGHLELTKA